jgi:hypothetical protein
MYFCPTLDEASVARLELTLRPMRMRRFRLERAGRRGRRLARRKCCAASAAPSSSASDNALRLR